MTTTERVLESVANVAGCNVADVTVDSDFFDYQGLNFDSLDCVEMVMDIEDEFEIPIHDGVAEKWATVGDVIKYVENAIC